MAAKITTSEKDMTKLDIPFVSEKSLHGENIEVTKKKGHQRAKSRRTVKLPRLKLAELVSQVTEENAHGEISTGQAVGNEVW